MGATPECGSYGYKEAKGYGKTRAAAETDADSRISKDISSTLEAIYRDSLHTVQQGGAIEKEKGVTKSVVVLKVSFSGTKYIKQLAEPYKDGDEWVSERYICKSDAAKPYLDSLRNINNQVSGKKITSGFCETLHSAYAPRVMSFEGLVKDFGEESKIRIDDYRLAKDECDEMSEYSRKGIFNFEEELDKAVAEISSRVRGKIKIVIAEIDDSPEKVSNFITVQLESKLVKVKTFSVIGHNFVESVNISNEQKFKMSGAMKYAEAVKIGKSLKADVVVIGSFDPYAKFSQFMIEAIDVQSKNMQVPTTLAMHTGMIRPDDMVLRDIIDAGKRTDITSCPCLS
jgi:hypothetical protein